VLLQVVAVNCTVSFVPRGAELLELEDELELDEEELLLEEEELLFDKELELDEEELLLVL